MVYIMRYSSFRVIFEFYPAFHNWLTSNLYYKEKIAPQAYLIPLDSSQPRQSFKKILEKF